MGPQVAAPVPHEVLQADNVGMDMLLYKCNSQYKQSTSRPLYGGGSGVCVYFVYVYIVF